MPLAALTADAVAQAFATAWGGAAASTWNRHRSAVRSFAAWASLDDLAAGLERRAGSLPGSRSRALAGAQLDALWSRGDLPLRERTLWCLLHESAAGVKAVLALDVEDLDLDDRRARTGRGWVSWRSRTAVLLPRLLAGRTRGPVFLSDRRPGRPGHPRRRISARTPAVGGCPTSGPSTCSRRAPGPWTRHATATPFISSSPGRRRGDSETGGRTGAGLRCRLSDGRRAAMGPSGEGRRVGPTVRTSCPNPSGEPPKGCVRRLDGRRSNE